MSDRDIFDLTFEALQKSLSYGSRKNNAEGVELAINNVVISQVRRSAVEHRKDLSQARQLLFEQYANEHRACQNVVAQIEGCRRLTATTCRLYEHIVQRRLAMQKSSSDRRMKDLVFEVVGEYGKSNHRINRRQEYLRKTGRTKLLVAVWIRNWQIFAARLKFDLCQAMLSDRQADPSAFVACQGIIQSAFLTATTDKDELEAVIRKLGKKVGLVSEKRVAVQAVVRVTKSGRDKGLLSSSFRVASNAKELQDIMLLLQSWAKRSAPAAQPANPAATNAAAARNVQSRGGSAMGTRPRPLPQSSIPYQGPLLKEVLSTSAVAWQHPPSYLSAHWDQVYTTQYLQDGAAELEQDVFTAFVRKYHAQHTGSLWNDRAYFCLEERSLATRSDSSGDTRAVSPDSALLAVLGGIADSNKEEKRVALENAITMQLLVTLQEIYVDHPYVYVTHAHESLRCGTAAESLKSLREILTQPLTVIGFSSKHRMGQAKQNSSKTTQIIHKYLPAVPDIMVVRAANGAVLHFAAAMMAHLPETQAFSAGCLSEELQRQSSLRCPHPQLSSLTIAGSHYVSALFCPVLTQLIDDKHVLREAAGAKNAPGMLTLGRHSAAVSSTAAVPPARIGAAETSTKKGDRHNHISTDVLPTSPLLMMPLPADAMQGLLLRYLAPQVPSASTAAGEQGSPSPAGAVQVLPDHARYRVRSQNLEAECGEPVRPLRCCYVLLPDDKAAEIAAAADTGTPRKASAGEASKAVAAVVPNPCYYLVQLYEVDEAGPQQAPRAEPVAAGSEIDDGSDPLSSTFSLTQSGKGGSARGMGKSVFDRHRQYDAEDDLLRAALLVEHRAALDCDVVLSPPRKEAKDSKSQRGQPQPTGGETAGKKAGGASLATGQQVVEDDQDEGDADDSNSGSGVAGGNAAAASAAIKRRWDPNVLSTVCRWRSCLCESALQRVGKSSTYKQKQLCSYHLELKSFVDARVGKSGALESSKYLPRKAPNFNAAAVHEKKRDMMTIRAASTLLQELWDGKLRATVRSFAKKVVRDMGLRAFLEAANTSLLIAHPSYLAYITGTADSHSRNAHNPFSVHALVSAKPALEQVANSVVPAQPTWAIWKNKAYYERTLEGQNLSLSILDAILLTEKTIMRELELLADLHAYPSAELVLIRREMKAFKEQQEEILAKTAAGSKSDLVPAALVGQREGGGAVDVSTEDAPALLSSGYDDLVAILSAENKLCERKLLLMACRRQEEEERRALYLKKLARAKAVEDTQARDPANFRNQRF